MSVRATLIKYFNKEPVRINLQGIQPVNFEHTAWDLAVATQWLAEIDPKIAFELTSVYGMQETYTGLSSGVLQAMCLRPLDADRDGFLQSVKVFYDDIVMLEPALLKKYAAVLPLIDSALRD